MDWPHAIWTALALLLILEALMPLISPDQWRKAMQYIAGLTDGQIRFLALMALLAGLLILSLL